MNKIAFVIVMSFLISGCGAMGNMQFGLLKLSAENYDGAIEDCMKAIESNRSQDKPTFLIEADYQVNLDFYSTTCLATAYQGKKNYETAKKYWLESINYFPQFSYMAYINLAKMSYLSGDLEGAIKYSQLGRNIVESNGFEKIVANRKRPLSKKLFMWDKKKTIAAEQFYRMRLSYKEMIGYFDIGNYKKTIDIGNNILNINNSFEVHSGLSVPIGGKTIGSIEEGTIADISGVVAGDKILEVNGIQFHGEDMQLLPSRASDSEKIIDLLSDYGATVEVKIERKGRVIPLTVRLSYPEVDATRNLISEAKLALSTPKNRKKIAGPWLKILEPKSARGIKINGTEKTAFRILASDLEPVHNVTVNGVSCSEQKPDLLEKTMLPGKINVFTIAMPLAQGENKFEVVAKNKNGQRISQKITINGSETNSKELDQIYKRRVAVVIGINKYYPWQQLEFAVNDAKSVKDKLMKMGFDKVIELYDKDATRARILRVLMDELPIIMGPDDALLVFFAGHGATEDLVDNGKEGYIMPVDASVDNYRGTAISMSSIHEMIKRYKAKHKLFIFDSCYSGLGLKRSGGAQTKKIDGFIRNMASKPVSFIMTAGGKDEQAQEKKGHGIFTKAILDAFDGEGGLAKDGYLLTTDMAQQVRKKVNDQSEGKQDPQSGVLSGEGDFIFDLNQVADVAFVAGDTKMADPAGSEAVATRGPVDDVAAPTKPVKKTKKAKKKIVTN